MLEWTDASAACVDPLIRLSSRSSGDAPIDDAAPLVVTLSDAGLSDVGDSTTAAVATVVVTAALKDSNKGVVMADHNNRSVPDVDENSGGNNSDTLLMYSKCHYDKFKIQH